MKLFLLEVSSRYIEAFKLFRHRRAMTLAAASSFYLILTIIPFFMLLVRTVGLFMGDVRETGHQILTMGQNLFPEKSSQMISLVEKIVEGPLFSGASFNIFNLLILIFSSLTFTNIIWSGLYLITEDKRHISSWKYLKGLVIILVTIVIFCVTLILPPVVQMFMELIQNNPMVSFLQEKYPDGSSAFGFLSSIKYGAEYLIQSHLLHASVFLVYFTFLYRWFFNWKISNSQAMVGTLTFVGALLVGKLLFYGYFVYLRSNLVANYGDYYTLVVALLWIFQLMCFFFYGACLCHVLEKKPLNVFQKASVKAPAEPNIEVEKEKSHDQNHN
ncbi:MAG: YihY/virulence factor BrkB family protein [Bacteriovoracaceae bacterium]|nr:YihY/virulence factor BrkB family protein [Bacteriovoracaceae bacterium]